MIATALRFVETMPRSGEWTVTERGQWSRGRSIREVCFGCPGCDAGWSWRLPSLRSFCGIPRAIELDCPTCSFPGPLALLEASAVELRLSAKRRI